MKSESRTQKDRQELIERKDRALHLLSLTFPGEVAARQELIAEIISLSIQIELGQ